MWCFFFDSLCTRAIWNSIENQRFSIVQSSHSFRIKRSYMLMMELRTNKIRKERVEWDLLRVCLGVEKGRGNGLKRRKKERELYSNQYAVDKGRRENKKVGITRTILGSAAVSGHAAEAPHSRRPPTDSRMITYPPLSSLHPELYISFVCLTLFQCEALFFSLKNTKKINLIREKEIKSRVLERGPHPPFPLARKEMKVLQLGRVVGKGGYSGAPVG